MRRARERQHAAGIWLDLGPRARRIFAGGYLALQLGIVLSGPLREDRIFGFQMFNASSTLHITLLRRVRAADGSEQVIPVEHGSWSVRDAERREHVLRWRDRVRDRYIGTLDRTLHARDGVDAQLFHLQRALEDVAAHIPQDTETVALIARVRAIDNGRPRPEIELQGTRR